MVKYRIIREHNSFFIQKQGYFIWKYVCGYVAGSNKVAVIEFKSELEADMFLLQITDTNKEILSTTTFTSLGKIMEKTQYVIHK